MTDRPFSDGDDGDEIGPAIVGLITNCKSLRALPRAGGVLDQDSFFIHMLGVFESAQAARAELDAKRKQAMQARKQH